MISVKHKFYFEDVIRQQQRDTVTRLYRASGYLRTTARRSIRKSANPSKPGTPPHTRRGQLRQSIAFAIDKENLTALIGPSSDLISDIAQYHEYGKTQYKKVNRKKYRIGLSGPIDRTGTTIHFTKLNTERQVARAKRLDLIFWPDSTISAKPRNYPKRPFMGPALENARSRIADIFHATLKPA